MIRKKRRYKKSKKLKIKWNPRWTWWCVWSLVSAGVLGFIGYAVYTSDTFRVNEKSITSNVEIPNSLKYKIKGESLFDLDIKSISEQLLRGRPEYKEVHVEKKFPFSLKIEVEKRIPFAQIKGKQYYLLDKEAVIINKGSSLPVEGFIPVEINRYDNFLRKGYRVRDESLMRAFDLIEIVSQEMFYSKFKVKMINAIHSQGMFFIIDRENIDSRRILLEKDIKVIIGNNNFSESIRKLRKLIDGELKDKMSLIKYIDLRHKNVYVGFKR